MLVNGAAAIPQMDASAISALAQSKTILVGVWLYRQMPKTLRPFVVRINRDRFVVAALHAAIAWRARFFTALQIVK
jgi:hypothetical protein